MSWRSNLGTSRFARAAAFPGRTLAVSRYNAGVLSASARWLVTSREFTNFTYRLTARNLEHLAWWISAVTGCPVVDARRFLQEPERDGDLRSHVLTATAASTRRGVADLDARYGRRLGWYALVRILQPEHVVETGTSKGLGACLLASALLKNGHGRLTTIDLDPNSGYLVGGRYAGVIETVLGDSAKELASLEQVDLLVLDSLHTTEHETAELNAAPLGEDSVVLSDNAHETDVLLRWAEQHGRRFLYFREQPADHWLPGEGIGIAWRG